MMVVRIRIDQEYAKDQNSLKTVEFESFVVGRHVLRNVAGWLTARWLGRREKNNAPQIQNNPDNE